MLGTRLLHYEITEKLGEGGMGVVYKARDTHLDRFVALKVLPPERVADPERRRRFLQEAKAASALNHPNIITVHHTAFDGGLDFIVMEFIAGKTLGELIGHKGLKLAAVLKYGAQIAEALAAAHAAAIVHRDLKPGNVMVTDSGLVKVLDFGLAKLAEPAIGEAASTRTMGPLTGEGVIVGTFAYMSPEQAHGKAVDARSDIFSFGSLLYEMVTSHRAFQGETGLATLSATAEKEPEPVSAVAGDTPPELEKLIACCIRKDPERRIQHMGDVRLALEELREESASRRPHLPALRRSRWAAPASVLFSIVVAAGIWWQNRSPQSAPVPALTRLTSDAGLTTDPALSPDGKLLAYASDRSGNGNLDIYVKQVGGGEPLRLTRGPGDKRTPAFSPDGTTIAFRSNQDGGVSVVSILGGPARPIGPGPAPAAYPVWSPDGEHLLFLGNPDNRVASDESIDWWVTPLYEGPVIKTGGLQVSRKAKLGGNDQVYPWLLIPSAWEPDGGQLVFSARSGGSTNLWRIGVSPRTWKVTGPAQRLTSGTTQEEAPSSVVSRSAGPSRIAFASTSQNLDVWSLPIEPNRGKAPGEPKRLTEDMGADFHPALSPDSKKMAWVAERSGSQEIWVRDLQTGEESAITVSRAKKWIPRFSPDGSKVSFGENNAIWVVPSVSGLQEMVCEACGEAMDWSSDGKLIIRLVMGGHGYWSWRPGARLTCLRRAARSLVSLSRLTIVGSVSELLARGALSSRHSVNDRLRKAHGSRS